jgi:hypothetical protein
LLHIRKSSAAADAHASDAEKACKPKNRHAAIGVNNGENMSVLLIEPILDRYIAQAEKRKKAWTAEEVEALLLRLRKEILDCLR